MLNFAFFVGIRFLFVKFSKFCIFLWQKNWSNLGQDWYIFFIGDDSLPRNVITFVVFNMAAVQKESDQRLDEFSYYNSLPRVFGNIEQFIFLSFLIQWFCPIGEDLKLRAPLFLIIAETSDDLNDVARNLKDEGFFVNILFQSDEVYVMEASLDMNQTPGSDFLAIRKKREITCYKCVIKNQSGKKNKKPSGNGGYGRGGYGYQGKNTLLENFGETWKCLQVYEIF